MTVSQFDVGPTVPQSSSPLRKAWDFYVGLVGPILPHSHFRQYVNAFSSPVKFHNSPWFLSSLSHTRIWNAIIFFIILYNAIVVPLRLGFEDIWDLNMAAFYCLDYAGDSLLIIDIFLNFRSAYYKHGVLSLEPGQVSVQEALLVNVSCAPLFALPLLFFPSLLHFSQLLCS